MSMEILSEAEYSKLKTYIYNKLGIEVDEKKRETVSTKVMKLVTRRNMSSPKDYVNFLLSTSDAAVVQEFFNEITTNTTEFFREVAHFDYIKNNISNIIADITRIQRDREIRIWSAPCSSGEEALTLAMVLKECLPQGINPKILATDISMKVLNKATKGIYTESECKGIPKIFLTKYFNKQQDEFYEAEYELKKHITYKLFNLTEDFHAIKRGFDIIFCRNLMIYFDHAAQEKLINKFYDVLVPNGLFFIGHSESLLNKKHKFRHIQTSVFKK